MKKIANMLIVAFALIGLAGCCGDFNRVDVIGDKRIIPAGSVTGFRYNVALKTVMPYRHHYSQLHTIEVRDRLIIVSPYDFQVINVGDSVKTRTCDPYGHVYHIKSDRVVKSLNSFLSSKLSKK